MSRGTLVSVNEYLSTTYRPDCDYVDGVLLERNVGEFDHSAAQVAVASCLHARRRDWGIRLATALRVRVRRDRVRVCDVCAILESAPIEQVIGHPPFLCVEILSKNDNMSDMMERVAEYLTMGVAWVWVLDPRRRRAWIHSTESIREVKDGVLRATGPDIEIPLAEIFPNEPER